MSPSPSAEAFSGTVEGGPPGEAAAAAFQAVVGGIDAWVAGLDHWPPMRSVSEDWADAGARLAGVGRALSRVLVVGVIGGTGTGKSTLVNALAGAEVSLAGDISRPTTTRPVVVAAEGTDCSWLPLADWHAKVVRTASPVVAEVVLVDCPDPDTQDETVDRRADRRRGAGGGAMTGPDAAAEGGSPNRNRDILQSVLPSCDVLLLVSTAQKYRSWAVAREVVRFAPGRPLLFVQTHASRDPDIREDWKRELAGEGFDVPIVYRLDGVEAIRRADAGLPHEPGFAELCHAIESQLAARAAGRVRRTGASDLLEWFLRRSATRLAEWRAPVTALEDGLAAERTRLENALAARLSQQLIAARRDWRRLLAREWAGEGWTSPFGGFLSAIDRLLASWPGLDLAGPGLVGRVLAGRVTGVGEAAGGSGAAVAGRTAAEGIAPGMAAVHDLGISEADLEQSRSILVGLAARAGIREPQVGRARLPAERTSAIAGEVVARAGHWLDDGIARLIESRRHRVSTRTLRWAFEIAFGGFVLAVLGRAAWGFFHDRLWAGQPSAGGGLLWESIPWVVLWGLLLRWLAGMWIRWGLEGDLRNLMTGLPRARLIDPILEDFSAAATQTANGLARFDAIALQARPLTAIAVEEGGSLGRLRREGEAILSGPA